MTRKFEATTTTLRRTHGARQALDAYQGRNLLRHHPSVRRHASYTADERQSRRTCEDLHRPSPAVGVVVSENIGNVFEW